MSSYKIRKTPGDTEWFRHDRFGMFIHFGLYALPARHEWVKNRESLTDETYDRYFKHFNPDLFDAREWARQAKKAGTQQYRDFYRSAVAQGLTVKFHKVKGHSGDKYNDMADRLAKDALGIK